MGYTFLYTRRAAKEFARLDQIIKQRIQTKLEWFCNQDDPLKFAAALHDFEKGDMRFRIGDYRILCSVDYQEQWIYILSVGHRSAIYR